MLWGYQSGMTLALFLTARLKMNWYKMAHLMKWFDCAFFHHYLVLNDRASRREFWWYQLVVVIINIGNGGLSK